MNNPTLVQQQKLIQPNPTEKRILVDVDGVLLDYFTPFTQTFNLKQIKSNVNSFEDAFMLAPEIILEMVDKFNHSESFSSLPPFKDAVEYITKLKEEGYIIDVITAAGRSPDIIVNRIKNLEVVFGKDTFNKYMFVEHTESKLVHLTMYQNSGFTWIEDSIKNYYLGLRCGLDSVLMDTDFNHTETRLQHYFNWEDIYNHITNYYKPLN